MQKEFRETVPQGEPFREAHVVGDTIQGVALLGSLSLNNRVYTQRALEDAARLYDHVSVFVNHPTESEMQDRDGVRSVMDLAGQVLNARVVGEQVRGDIQIMNREPTKSLFLAIATQMPGIAGMSHRARGTVEIDEDGKETVTSIDRVFAVELVADPATVNGLFESINESMEGRKMKKKFKEITDESIIEASHELFNWGNPWGTPDASKKAVTTESILEARRKLFV